MKNQKLVLVKILLLFINYCGNVNISLLYPLLSGHGFLKTKHKLFIYYGLEKYDLTESAIYELIKTLNNSGLIEMNNEGTITLTQKGKELLFKKR